MDEPKDELLLHRAAEEGDLEMVVKLVSLKTPLDRRDDQGRTPLHCAAKEGRYAVVDFLIGLPGCDLNLRDSKGYTPMLLAADCNRKSVVDLLLQRRAQVNCASRDKWTLLHHASFNNWADTAQYILDRGEADLNAATCSGNTPLMWAACEGHEEVTGLLIGAGADVHRSDVDKWTALHYAASYGHSRVLQLLLEVEGLDLNPQDENGMTPLRKACYKGHREVVQQLLVAGAVTTIKNNKGETALSVGIRLEKLTLDDIRLFVQHGASLEDCDYVRISQNPDLKESVFKDVDLIIQSVRNKYHCQSLPANQGNPNLDEKLPPIDVLKSSADHVLEAENSVKCGLRANPSCNIVKSGALSKALIIMCKLAIVISLFLILPETWHGSAALLVIALKYIF